MQVPIKIDKMFLQIKVSDRMELIKYKKVINNFSVGRADNSFINIKKFSITLNIAQSIVLEYKNKFFIQTS